jgi:hypothetical protein
MATFHVWVATPTFLYLPVYALERLGILDQVFKTVSGHDAKIIVRVSPQRGDDNCIKHMLHCASNGAKVDDIINVAIGDPYAAIDVDPAGKDARLLGAFLKAPTFWVIGREKGLSPNDLTLLCYDDSFKTSHAIAKRFKGAYGTVEAKSKPGEEIDQLFDRPEEQAKPGSLRVLTSDIIGVELACMRSPDVEVIKRMSADYKDFVTTGVLTHANVLKTRAHEIALFMEALRAACMLLKTAPQATATLVQRLSREKEFAEELKLGKMIPAATELSDEQSLKIANRIFAEGLYDDSLLISHAEWRGRVDLEVLPRSERREADAYFYRVYRKAPAIRHLEAWIEKAMVDYARFAREAKERRLLLVGMVFALITMFAGWRITEYIAQGQAPAASSPWSRTGHVIVMNALIIGMVVGLSPYLRRVLILFNLDRFVAMDERSSAQLTVFGGFLSIILPSMVYYWTQGVISDSLLGLITSIAAVFGSMVPIIFFQLFPRLAHR